MTAAFKKTGLGNLTGTKEQLGDLYGYGHLRLFRAFHGKELRFPYSNRDEYFVTQLAPNSNVILSQRGRICAKLKDHSSLFDIHLVFLLVPQKAPFLLDNIEPSRMALE